MLKKFLIKGIYQEMSKMTNLQIKLQLDKQITETVRLANSTLMNKIISKELQKKLDECLTLSRASLKNNE